MHSIKNFWWWNLPRTKAWESQVEQLQMPTIARSVSLIVHFLSLQITAPIVSTSLHMPDFTGDYKVLSLLISVSIQHPVCRCMHPIAAPIGYLNRWASVECLTDECLAPCSAVFVRCSSPAAGKPCLSPLIKCRINLLDKIATCFMKSEKFQYRN